MIHVVFNAYHIFFSQIKPGQVGGDCTSSKKEGKLLLADKVQHAQFTERNPCGPWLSMIYNASNTTKDKKDKRKIGIYSFRLFTQTREVRTSRNITVM